MEFYRRTAVRHADDNFNRVGARQLPVGSGELDGEDNLAPAITSDGGGESGALSIVENGSAVTTVAATDPEAGAIAYSISGGADAARFAINSATGALAFVAAPNYEAPADADADNVYQVTVRASDGALWDEQALAVTVTNADDAVTITSYNGAAAFTVTYTENQISPMDRIEATSAVGPITYSIVGGADAAKFEISPTGGGFSFAWASRPNYEAPTDADGDNRYEVVVQASNGLEIDQQALTVRVYNINEQPIFTSYNGAASVSLSVLENGVVAADVSAADPEGMTFLSHTIVGGADAALFSVNPWNGLVTFRSVPNFEAPADAGLNNVYDVVVRAFDGQFTVTQTLAITVTNEAVESPISGTSSSNTINGTAGADKIYGLGGIDTLSGLGGDDLIDGGAGNDTIVGGAGADQLLGGASGDTFRYDAVADSTAGSVDFIFDFFRSQSDKISLSAIDANSALAGDQAFAFISTSAFSGVAGQLRYEQVAASTFVYGDVDGDMVADFQLQLNGELNLFSSDFLL